MSESNLIALTLLSGLVAISLGMGIANSLELFRNAGAAIRVIFNVDSYVVPLLGGGIGYFAGAGGLVLLIFGGVAYLLNIAASLETVNDSGAVASLFPRPVVFVCCWLPRVFLILLWVFWPNNPLL